MPSIVLPDLIGPIASLCNSIGISDGPVTNAGPVARSGAVARSGTIACAGSIAGPRPLT
jgi:hypothetical protein